MKSTVRLAAGLSGVLMVSVFAGASRAEPIQFGVRAGGNYSDNVERVPSSETSSSSGIVGVDFSGKRESGRLQYDVFGNVEYQHYFEDDIDPETYGQMYATSQYAIVPERFLWGLSGSFDQTRRDLLRPIAPGNMEDVISLSTGPQVNMRFGSELEATLEGHYMLADYADQPFDNDTMGGSLIFGRALSTLSFVGVGGSFDQINYDDDGTAAEDFDRQELFLRFNARGARTTLDVDAGYSEVDSESFEDDGPMFRVHATRDLTASLSAFADYTQEFPTGGATFSPEAPPQLGTDSSVLTGGPRQSEDMGVGLRLNTPRTDASLSFVLREEEDLETGIERSYDTITASGTYTFAPRASFSLFARFVDEEVAAVQSEEQIFGGRLNFQIGRLTTVSLRIEQRSRDSDAPEGEYEEMAAGLFLRYGNSTGAEGWR